MKRRDEDLAAWSAHREEWALLHAASKISLDQDRDAALPALSALAEHYQQRGAWDEYSAIRARMLELTPRRQLRARGGPPSPAGGPFPRIGAPREGSRPATLLGRWLNRSNLPELFETPEVTPRQLERSLRAALARSPEPGLYTRIGDALCVQLRFREVEQLYKQSNTDRMRDVLRVLRGPPD